MSNGPVAVVAAVAGVAEAVAAAVAVGGTPPDPIPTCIVYASDSAPLVGTPIVLSASCNGNPTFVCLVRRQLFGVQCATSMSIPGTAAYSVVARNATGTGNAAGITVEWKTPVAVPTPQCTLNASDTAPLIGQTITITSSCTNSPTSYAWAGCASTDTTCTDSVGVEAARSIR